MQQVLWNYVTGVWTSFKKGSVQLIRKVYSRLAAFERKHAKIIGLVLLIGGIIRIEIVEYSAIEREKELLKEVQICTSQLTKQQDLKAKLDSASLRISELELELDAYKLAVIMYMAGEVDTMFVKETVENYE